MAWRHPSAKIHPLELLQQREMLPNRHGCSERATQLEMQAPSHPSHAKTLPPPPRLALLLPLLFCLVLRAERSKKRR
jgi:hypothetical protein